MKFVVTSLMYHDVVVEDRHQESGFPTPDAALYKLDPDLFRRHLEAINRSVDSLPILIDGTSPSSIPPRGNRRQAPWTITFDDGGLSSHTHIAEALEKLGWRGHFFITAGYIGTPSFLDAEQILDLKRRGHAIGAHSYSHPLRMGSCGWDTILREWSMSVECLSDITGEKVRLASVPGGQYNKEVAEAASKAGIKTLFTSEPTCTPHQVSECMVFGRYSVQRWMQPQTAAAIARGALTPRLRQTVLWNSKKVIKALGGEYYLKLRSALASRNTT